MTNITKFETVATLKELEQKIDAALAAAESPIDADNHIEPINAALGAYGYEYSFYSAATAQTASGDWLDVVEYRDQVGNAVSVTITCDEHVIDDEASVITAVHIERIEFADGSEGE